MKLALLIAALCASCTAFTVAPQMHPKPQLGLQQANKASKANKVLALRGGGAPTLNVDPTVIQKALKFRKIFKASDGLVVVFLWSVPYLLGAIPGPIGRFVQKKFFETVYLKDDAELAYIRWEILWILGSLANTLVLMITLDQNVRVRRCAAVWGTTFTLAFLKFYVENERGWITGNYRFAQLIHASVALSCWWGVAQSLA